MPCDDHCYGRKKSRVRGETVVESGLIFVHSVVRKGLSEKVEFGNLIRNLTELREEHFSLKEEQVHSP